MSELTGYCEHHSATRPCEECEAQAANEVLHREEVEAAGGDWESHLCDPEDVWCAGYLALAHAFSPAAAA